MGSPSHLRKQREDRLKLGIVPQNTNAMRFPEIVDECFEKVWRELENGKNDT